MASSISNLLARSLNGTYGYGTAAQVQTNATENGRNNTQATFNLIQNLVFAQSKSVRTSTIVLAAFNILAAFATAASILYDCYWSSKRCNPKFRASKFCLSQMHPAETFPLIISIGIVCQGLVFAGVQGTGLDSLFIKGCGRIAQFIWPALFIVPYLQTVFGIECALRSLRKLPFQARGKYDVTICSVVVVLMLVGTWVISFINPEPNSCFASLIWYVSAFGFEGLIISSACGGLMMISAMTIFIRLSSVNMIDQHQRIAASRMVYYLVLGLLSLAFVIPYYVSQTIGNGDIKAAMIATVVVNLSGLMTGLLQLFLRSNTATTSFGPKSGRSWDLKKHQIRMFGPNELAFNNLLMDPVSGPRSAAELPGKSISQTNLVGWEAQEKERAKSMESIRSPPPIRSPMRYNPLTSNSTTVIRTIPKPTEPLAELPSKPINSSQQGHARKQSYSLFPNGLSTNPRQEQASVYDINDLLPPPDIFGSKSRGHRRDSSVVSSATVQIGLRLSGFPMSPSKEDIASLPLPSNAYNAGSARAILPLQIQTNPRSILKQPKASQNSPSQPKPLNIGAKSPSQNLLESPAGVNKMLPPTPLNGTFAPIAQRVTEPEKKEEKNGEPCQLSPAVYSPKKKVVESPTSSRQRSDSGREPPPGINKEDWI